MPTMPVTNQTSPRESGRLIETHGAALPLEGCGLEVDARGGLARVRLVQRFSNPNPEPLGVTYKLPLPADAAVSGFSFRIGARTIHGVVDGKQAARDRFEQAVIEGKSAALLEQDRSSLFTQEIGNIPPGEVVEATIDIDQPLAWLDEGSWEWRFPLAAAPRYLGAHDLEEGTDVSIDVATSDIGARASLSMRIRDALAEGRSPESPSHPLVCARANGAAAFAVELGSGNAVMLDRDLVVRWPAAELVPGVTLDVMRPSEASIAGSAYGLLTIVPPRPEARRATVHRDLTLLIDTSGSMSGEPLVQAQRVACALVDALGDDDQLEMIEFSSETRAFRAAPERATKALKRTAIDWIRRLVASGGTEMLSGVKHAMRELRPGSQRQVVLITDGLVGFEREIVTTLLAELPRTARLHALGVGSAVNRSLLAPIARAGRGIEAIVGLGEDPERAAKRLLSRTVAPALVDVVIEGSALRSVAPSRPSDVYAGAPLRLAVELAPEGGTLVVRGRTAEGGFVRDISVPATRGSDGGHATSAVFKLFARERVEDLEMKIAAGEERGATDREIERIGISFGIATRLTSWVAVSDERMVDPRDPSRHVVQPHALAHGLSAEGLGLRAPMMAPGAMRARAVGGRGAAFARATGAPPPPMSAAPMSGPMGPPGMGPPPAPPAPARPSSPAPFGGGGAPKKAAKEESPGDALFERAKAKIGGLFRSAEKRRPSPAADARDEGAASDDLALAEERDAPSVIEGSIVHANHDAIVISFTAPPSGVVLSFEAAVVEVELEDGSTARLEIDATSSTREGHVGPGLVVRLTLRRTSRGARPRRVRVTLPGSGLTVEAR